MALPLESLDQIPLTSNGIPVRNLWYMLVYAMDDRRLLDRFKSNVESAPSLDGLLATMLAKMLTRRLRIGLGRNYRNHAETLNGLRGRVDFATSLKRMTFQSAKAHCTYQVFAPNVPKNQIIRATLEWVVQNGDFGPEQMVAEKIRRDLKHLIRRLAHIDLIEARAETVRRQLLERDDHDYRVMLTLCELILTQQMPSEEIGKSTSHRVDRNWRFVCYIYEAFVANFLKIHAKEWATTSQKVMHWPSQEPNALLPTMRPDIVMKSRKANWRVVLDTKFTKKCLKRGRSERLKFPADHLYQLYAYLRTQESYWGKMTGVLLYPAVEFDLHETVKIDGHTIRWEVLDLAQEWTQIESGLMELVNSFAAEDERCALRP